MKYTKLIIYNVSILLALFFMVEAGFRIGAPGYQFYERTYGAKFEEKARFILDTNWVQRDIALGWVCRQKKNLKFYRPDFFEVEYEINAQGFRGSAALGRALNKEGTHRKVLLLGDSFLFGIFLKNEQTISAQLQRALGTDYEVYNMAVPGWGLDQMYQAYSKYIDQIKPDQVILFYIDDDISRVMEALYWGAASKRAYKLENKKLLFRGAEDGKLNKVESFFCFNSQLINRLYKISIFKRAKPLSKAILQELIEAEAANGRTLTAIRFPRKEQIGNDYLKLYDLEDFFKSQNCSFLDMEKEIRQLPRKEYLNFYIPGDDHPSVVGARYVVGELKTLFD